MQNRLTVLAHDGATLTQPLPGSFHDVAAHNGRFILQGSVPASDRRGLPVHVLDGDGALLRSFGTPLAGTSPYLASAPRPMVVRAGHVWIAQRNRYRIEQWIVDGNFVKALERPAPWFRPWEELAPGEPTEAPPSTHLVSMMADERGWLWLLFHVPDANWTPSPGALTDGRHDRVFDTIIEVIDPATARVIATARTDRWLSGFVPPARAYALRSERDGNIVIDVWEVVLDYRRRQENDSGEPGWDRLRYM